MFGNVSCGVPGEDFKRVIDAVKAERGVALDTELDADALRGLTSRFLELYELPHDAWSNSGAPCSAPRRAAAPLTTAASTASRTTGAPGSTCSRWCLATRATPPARAWHSAATKAPARPRRTATTSCPTPRART